VGHTRGGAAHYRGKEPRALFTASTLKRALFWKVDEKTKLRKASEAIDRWLDENFDGEAAVRRHRQSIKVYISKALSKTLKGVRSAPLVPIPSDKACLEQTKSKGGTRATLLKDLEEAKARITQPRNFSLWWGEARFQDRKERSEARARVQAALNELDAFWVYMTDIRNGDYLFEPGTRNLGLISELCEEYHSQKGVDTSDIRQKELCTIADPDTDQFYRSLDGIGQLPPLRLYKKVSSDSLQDMHPLTYAQVAAELDILSEHDSLVIDLNGYYAVADYSRMSKLEKCLYLSRHKEPRVRPVALVEPAAKVRVASLHPAAHAQVSRMITARMLPRLGSLVSHRAVLKDSEVDLAPYGRGARLFSADLSAATDWIPHEVAQYMFDVLCETLEEPDWVRAEGRKLLGPHRLDDGRVTKRGIHMGLGHGWTILSLLNSYAAWKAGAPKDSFAVMGDDLIGFWSDKVCRKYMAVLVDLGMKVNHSKSFKGPRGVFCERLVQTAKDGNARASMYLTLSEAMGSKAGWGFSSDWVGTIQGLRKPVQADDPLSKAADITLSKLSVNNLPEGPLELGGCGKGVASPDAIFATILFGKMSLRTSKDRNDTLNKVMGDNQPKGGGIRIQDAKQALWYGRELQRANAGTCEQTKLIHPKSFYRQSRARLKRLNELASKSGRTKAALALAALKERIPRVNGGTQPKCNLSSSARSRLHRLIKANPTLSNRSRRRGITSLLSEDRTMFCSIPELQEALKDLPMAEYQPPTSAWRRLCPDYESQVKYARKKGSSLLALQTDAIAKRGNDRTQYC
jgi:hypothetical protein